MSVAVSAHTLRWYEPAPLLPAEHVRAFGPTLVVAPHPDDEVLGCGGTIALLRQAKIPVRVVVVSDGSASHPGSRRYPPATLGALRRSESLAGLERLGVALAQVACLGLPDGAVPRADAPSAQQALDALHDLVLRWPEVRTILLPWRRDPHDDHRAVSSLVTATLDGLRSTIRRLEYPIWTMVHPGPDDPPRVGEATLWRLDIGAVGEQKRAAILAHRSQTTAMIDDAEIGHCLTAPVLEQFARPWELFIEVPG